MFYYDIRYFFVREHKKAKIDKSYHEIYADKVFAVRIQKSVKVTFASAKNIAPSSGRQCNGRQSIYDLIEKNVSDLQTQDTEQGSK